MGNAKDFNKYNINNNSTDYGELFLRYNCDRSEL